MKIRRILWYDYVEEKLLSKDGVSTEEVEQAFKNRPRIFWKETGLVEGEDLHNALGQTDSGRRLSIFFILKRGAGALIISAREMNERERKRFAKK
jgi:uncharacterized DUF497 family protein